LRILFIGDVVGRSGREALEKYLPSLKAKLKPDVVIVNGENAASGIGITDKICKQFYEWGVDVITSGNHIWRQREIMHYIDKDARLLRPINYPNPCPGKGVYKHTLQDYYSDKCHGPGFYGGSA
jgi:calcineurin-like phosphoesterase